MTTGYSTQAPDNHRLTDESLMQEAAGLLAAADAYNTKYRWDASWTTTHFLLGRAIELALKGFLLRKLLSEAQLRSIGHNLQQLWYEATAKGLRLADAGGPPDDTWVIARLNRYYRTKALEYPEVGPYAIVNAIVIRRLGHRLVSALHAELEGCEPRRQTPGFSIPEDVFYRP